MAPTYKLTYFDITGIAEPIRYLLSYGGIEFEDKRTTLENWPSLKPNTPLGQIPIFEHNDKIGYQSIAICRYVARQVKLTGKDDWEDLEIDATVDTLSDLRLKFAPYYYEKDEKIKEAKGQPIFNEILPFYVEKLDTQVKNNHGYFVNGHLTWADVYFAAIVDYLCHMVKKDIIAIAPNLRQLKENVWKIPNIKSWIETRPKTPY